jgi:phosphoribosylanthranilate isomerase
MTTLRIKICGVTTRDDAVAAADLGADAVGLNFYPQSPRYVDPEITGYILRALPPFVEAVGVFVNVPFRTVFQTLNQLIGVRTFQWHGEQRELADTFPFRHIAAFAVKDKDSLRAVQQYLDACRPLNMLPSALLLDGHVPDKYGGTGKMAPWNLLADFNPGVPVILAGGLTPENVAEAVRTVRPYAVDVASGVESSPGVKDVDKMARFIDNARSAV